MIEQGANGNLTLFFAAPPCEAAMRIFPVR
jgi:hypothetical protein